MERNRQIYKVTLVGGLVNVVLLIGANALSRKFTDSSLW